LDFCTETREMWGGHEKKSFGPGVWEDEGVVPGDCFPLVGTWRGSGTRKKKKKLNSGRRSFGGEKIRGA